MGLHAMWAHGTAFAPPENPSQGLENVDNVPYTDVLGLRQGWGASWVGDAGSANWFHVSIPTPAVVDDATANLKRVFVMYSTGQGYSLPTQGGPQVTDVHVWDGASRIQTFGTVEGFGDRRFSLDAKNTFVLPSAPPIRFGVGISVRVQFTAIDEQRIEFAAAGAEFELAPLIFRLIPGFSRFQKFRSAGA
jgi:uncharacterized protein DUF6623